jgi:hypothetical protein
VSSGWSDQLITELTRITAGAFEAVGASSPIIDANSGLARGAGVGLESGWPSRWLSQSDYLVMSPGQVAAFWIMFTNASSQRWNRGLWGRQANGLNGDVKVLYRNPSLVGTWYLVRSGSSWLLVPSRIVSTRSTATAADPPVALVTAAERVTIDQPGLRPASGLTFRPEASGRLTAATAA